VACALGRPKHAAPVGGGIGRHGRCGSLDT